MLRLPGILIIAASTAVCGCTAPMLRISTQQDLLASGQGREKEQTLAVARVENLALPPVVTPIEPARIAMSDVASQSGAIPRTKSLREISLDIAPPTLVSDQNKDIVPPQNYAAAMLPALASEQPFTRGDMAAAGLQSHPSPEGLIFCYQPLYFEEVNLERYGRSWGCLQPFVSAAHFYSRIPALPYMVFARPARRCTYHAHWTLPGYRIPQREPQPLVPSVTGALAETAVIYGIALLIP